MIDPPPVPVGHPERKAACQLATDYAVQLIEEEAHLVGWTRAEILIAICDSADARLSALTDGEAIVEADVTSG